MDVPKEHHKDDEKLFKQLRTRLLETRLTDLRIEKSDAYTRGRLNEEFGTEDLPVRPFPVDVFRVTYHELSREDLSHFWRIKDGMVYAYRELLTETYSNWERHAFSSILPLIKIQSERPPTFYRFYSRGFFLAQYLGLDKLKPCTLIVGSPNSGKQLLLDELKVKSPLKISGRNFQNSETMNVLTGSAPGYKGSDKPTSFAEDVKSGKFTCLVIANTEIADPFLLSSFLTDWKSGFFDEKTGIYGKIKTKAPVILLANVRVDPKPSLIESALEEKRSYLSAIRNPISGKAAISEEILALADEIYTLPNVSESLELTRAIFPSGMAELFYKYGLNNRKIQEIVSVHRGIREFEGRDAFYLKDGMNQIIGQKTRLSKDNFKLFIENLKNPEFFGQKKAVQALCELLALKITTKIERPMTAIFVGPRRFLWI